MGFGLKIAPGVRVSVSKRGVRTSIGPRLLRVHVGAGRAGISTGIGPLSIWGSLGGTSKARSRTTYSSSYGLTLNQANKLEEAQNIEARLNALTKVHLKNFEQTRKPVAGRRQLPPLDLLAKAYFEKESANIGFFKFNEKQEARTRSESLAKKEYLRLQEIEDKNQIHAQELLDAEWELVIKNDPDTVMNLLANAFGDTEAKAAPLEVIGSTLNMLVLVPAVEILPDRDWSITSAGNLSVRNMKAADRNAYYFELVFSNALAAVYEAFAVAPGIRTINLVILRNGAHPRTGEVKLDCLGFGTILKSKLPARTTQDSPYACLQRGSEFWQAKVESNLKLTPVDLAGHSDIQTLIRTAETDL